MLLSSKRASRGDDTTPRIPGKRCFGLSKEVSSKYAVVAIWVSGTIILEVGKGNEMIACLLDLFLLLFELLHSPLPPVFFLAFYCIFFRFVLGNDKGSRVVLALVQHVGRLELLDPNRLFCLFVGWLVLEGRLALFAGVRGRKEKTKEVLTTKSW